MCISHIPIYQTGTNQSRCVPLVIEDNVCIHTMHMAGYVYHVHCAMHSASDQIFGDYGDRKEQD